MAPARISAKGVELERDKTAEVTSAGQPGHGVPSADPLTERLSRHEGALTPGLHVCREPETTTRLRTLFFAHLR
jgi:hypothetical protein